LSPLSWRRRPELQGHVAAHPIGKDLPYNGGMLGPTASGTGVASRWAAISGWLSAGSKVSRSIFSARSLASICGGGREIARTGACRFQPFEGFELA